MSTEAPRDASAPKDTPQLTPEEALAIAAKRKRKRIRKWITWIIAIPFVLVLLAEGGRYLMFSSARNHWREAYAQFEQDVLKGRSPAEAYAETLPPNAERAWDDYIAFLRIGHAMRERHDVSATEAHDALAEISANAAAARGDAVTLLAPIERDELRANIKEAASLLLSEGVQITSDGEKPQGDNLSDEARAELQALLAYSAELVPAIERASKHPAIATPYITDLWKDELFPSISEALQPWRLLTGRRIAHLLLNDHAAWNSELQSALRAASRMRGNTLINGAICTTIMLTLLEHARDGVRQGFASESTLRLLAELDWSASDCARYGVSGERFSIMGIESSTRRAEEFEPFAWLVGDDALLSGGSPADIYNATVHGNLVGNYALLYARCTQELGAARSPDYELPAKLESEGLASVDEVLGEGYADSIYQIAVLSPLFNDRYAPLTKLATMYRIAELEHGSGSAARAEIDALAASTKGVLASWSSDGESLTLRLEVDALAQLVHGEDLAWYEEQRQSEEAQGYSHDEEHPFGPHHELHLHPLAKPESPGE